MAKRSHATQGAEGGADDDAARRAAKKQRKLERQQQQQQQQVDQGPQQVETVDPYQLLVQHGQQQGGYAGAGPVDVHMNATGVETDEAARLRRKSDRKAAKKAAKEAASAVALPAVPVEGSGHVGGAVEDEKARKKAERKEAKRLAKEEAKRAAAAGVGGMQVEPISAPVNFNPAPAAPTVPDFSSSNSSKKDKKKHKEKHKSSSAAAASPSFTPTVSNATPALSTLSAQDTYLSQSHHPVDPTLAGLLSDFGVSSSAIGSGVGASGSASRAGDIPVFSTSSYGTSSTAPAPFATGPYPSGDIPVTSSSSSHGYSHSHSHYDIPVDPVLLGPSHMHHPAAGASSAAFLPPHKHKEKEKHKKKKNRDKHLALAPTSTTPAAAPAAAAVAAPAAAGEKDKAAGGGEEFDVAALTARALLKAKEQHERETRERAGAAVGAGQGKDKEGKGKKDKGKGKEKAPAEEDEDDDEDLEDLDAVIASARRAAPPVNPASSSKKNSSATTSSTSTSTAKKVPAASKSKTTSIGSGGGGAGSNDFYEQLVTKWMPVKELKKLAEETGCTYKQGKFSASEDALIHQTLDTFRDNHNMTQEELVTLMTTKRTDKDKNSSSPSSTAVTSNEAWELVARALGDRSLLAIYNHVHRLLAPSISGASTGRWTKEEDDALRRAVKELGNQWEEVGRRVGGRTGGACRDRWTKQLAPGGGALLASSAGASGASGAAGQEGEGAGEKGEGEGGQRRGKWTKEEEDELRDLVGEEGKSWSLISRKMGGRRSATQCRTKWNDFLNRRDAAPGSSSSSTAHNVNNARSSSSSATNAIAALYDDGGRAKKDRDAWRWRAEHASWLVHSIASLSPLDPSEIDWKTIPDPSGTLTHHGPKNLRDRFRYLVGVAKGKVVEEKRERGRMERGAGGVEEVSFKDALAQLLKDHPTPGVAAKRSYNKNKNPSGTKRSAKLAASSANNAAHILVGDGTGQSTLSREMVHSSDEEDGSDSDEGEYGGFAEQREPDLRVHDDTEEEDEDEEEDFVGMRMEDMVVDPLADFHKGLVDQLTRAD